MVYSEKFLGILGPITCFRRKMARTTLTYYENTIASLPAGDKNINPNEFFFMRFLYQPNEPYEIEIDQ